MEFLFGMIVGIIVGEVGLLGALALCSANKDRDDHTQTELRNEK